MTAVEKTTDESSTDRLVVGKVVSNKMDKTIVVEIERKVKHKLYGKYMRRFTKMKAHDNDNICKIGDLVQIKQCRPLSKSKFWTLVAVVNQVEQESV